MTDDSAGDVNPADEELLDRLFGDFVARLADGRTIDPESELPDRPDLRERVRELHSLAESVAVRRAVDRGLPQLPGYQLIRELGRGGMGTVWLARHEKLNRVVALKTMAAPLRDGSRGRDRFDREARAVARLKHPSILQVFEVGEHEGVAYFTMEYVEGRSLAQAIEVLKRSGADPATLRGVDLARAALGDERATLPDIFSRGYVEACCRLAIDIAYALMHAHEQGVIHRDVKPSNVLLRHDGRALLFDFGLARVADEGTLTLTGDFVGSPLYVSPEQAAGHNDTLTAQTDVYSLGVTLFELLTLDVPFRGKTTHEILERIKTREAPGVRRFNPTVSVDLAVVIATALEKDLTRRYRSALDFAADLERFLQFQPVFARPVGWVTRSYRFAQRNKAWTVAGVLLAVLVVVVPTAMLLQARDATRRIERQARKAETINQYLEDMLSSASPDELGHDVRVVDVLAGARRSLASLAHEPEVAIALRRTIAKTYESIGEPKVAVELFEEARALAATDALDPSHVRAKLDVQYGWALAEAGELRRAKDALESAAGELEAAYGRDSEATLAALNNLANVIGQLGDREASIALLREVHERRRRTLGVDHKTTTLTEYNLATALVEAGNAVDAEPLLRALLARAEGDPSASAMRVRILKQLGIFEFMMRGDPVRALPLLEEAASEAANVFGAESYITTIVENDRAMVLAMTGRRDETIPVLERNLGRFVQLLGETHNETAVIANNLAYLLNLSLRFADAERVVRRSLPPLLEKYGFAYNLVFDLHGELRNSLRNQGRYPELAEEVARVADSSAQLAPAQLGKLALIQAEIFFYFGHLDEADESYRAAIAHFDTASATRIRFNDAISRRVDVLLLTGRIDEAAEFLAERVRIYEEGGVENALAQNLLDARRVRVALESGRHDEAATMALALQRRVLATRGAVDPVVFDATESRVSALIAAGDAAAAIEAAREAVEWIRATRGAPAHLELRARVEWLRALVEAREWHAALRLSAEIAADRLCLASDSERTVREYLLEIRALIGVGAIREARDRALGIYADADLLGFADGNEEVTLVLAEARLAAGEVGIARDGLVAEDRRLESLGVRPEAAMRRRCRELLERCVEER